MCRDGKLKKKCGAFDNSYFNAIVLFFIAARTGTKMILKRNPEERSENFQLS